MKTGKPSRPISLVLYSAKASQTNSDILVRYCSILVQNKLGILRPICSILISAYMSTNSKARMKKLGAWADNDPRPTQRDVL